MNLLLQRITVVGFSFSFFGCTTEHMCYAVIVEIHAAVCAVKPAVTQATD